MTLAPSSRPRLARKARLRFDRKTDRWMLLYPERGLVLNATAAAALERCTGERTVDAIAGELAAAFGADVATVRAEVLALLAALGERGLVEDAGP